MSESWYPSPKGAVEATRHLTEERLGHDTNDDLDWESALIELANEGNVEALETLRRELLPVDYDELGWGD